MTVKISSLKIGDQIRLTPNGSWRTIVKIDRVRYQLRIECSDGFAFAEGVLRLVEKKDGD